MSYLPDYITWRGDLPFAADPANDLDTLVMAALSYIDLPAETQVFAQCANAVPPDDPDDHFRGECRRLLQQIAKSSRFGALTVRDAVSVLNDGGLARRNAYYCLPRHGRQSDRLAGGFRHVV